MEVVAPPYRRCCSFYEVKLLKRHNTTKCASSLVMSVATIYLVFILQKDCTVFYPLWKNFTFLNAARFTASQLESMRRKLLLKSWKALRSVAILHRCPEGLLCCTCLQYNRTYTPSTRLIQRCVFCCSICLNSQTSSCIHRSSTLLQCMVYRSWVHRLFPTWQNRSISHCSIESAGLSLHSFVPIALSMVHDRHCWPWGAAVERADNASTRNTGFRKSIFFDLLLFVFCQM